jgi:plastocyanin
MLSRPALFAALALTLTGALGAACESTVEQDPTPVQTFKITPAPPGWSATRTAQAGVPGTPAATATGTAPNGTPAAGTTLTLIAASTLFDKEELQAPAGHVTIVLDNRDPGIPHNLQVFRGDNAQGDSLGMTEIANGPVQQTLELELEPGAYFYQCDVHPTSMKGTLTVS